MESWRDAVDMPLYEAVEAAQVFEQAENGAVKAVVDGRLQSANATIPRFQVILGGLDVPATETGARETTPKRGG